MITGKRSVIGGIDLVTIQDTELRQGIAIAIDKAKHFSHSVLASEVQKVNWIDPYQFYANGNKCFVGERFFWKDPDGEQIIVGLGVAKQIQSEMKINRFDEIEEKWQHVLKDAVIVGEQTNAGSGPTLFGGFSFDPLKKKTRLWEKFTESLFHLPKYMLTIIKGQAYLTTNIICSQQDDLRLVEKVTVERQALLESGSSVPEFTEPVINDIQEIHPEEWKESVTNLVKSFQESDLKKVVLARELRLRFENPVQVERVLSHLLMEQKESYIFAFEVNGDCFIGATPERLVKKENNQYFSTCLAGSIARGKDQIEDERLGESLLNDPKNLIEHHYVVEMIKEAMEETCDEVILPNKPQLMKTKFIQHLYTPVVGKSREGTSLFNVVNRLHPTPALGGLPKEPAVAKIREIEELDRGFYAAPIGWMDFHGNGEFAVAIRSALVQGKEASLFAGCGVVEDSKAESEYIETKIKFRPMLTALGGNQI